MQLLFPIRDQRSDRVSLRRLGSLPIELSFLHRFLLVWASKPVTICASSVLKSVLSVWQLSCNYVMQRGTQVKLIHIARRRVDGLIDPHWVEGYEAYKAQSLSLQLSIYS